MTATQWSNAGYSAIAQLLGMRAGLSFRPSQRASTETAIEQAMHLAGTPDLDSYLRILEADPEKLDALLARTTVAETYFFRDPNQSEVIRKQILPEICARTGRHHKLRIWSAGCASGEEPYSLAMLLQREGLLPRATILGTDISREALERAREADYRIWSLRGEGKELAMKYLTEIDGRYRVKPEIRQAVRYEYLNLAVDNYPSITTGTWGLDLIICRNVMIYFDRETIRSIVTRFHRCLSEGGWLVTAASDPAIHDLGLFEVVQTEHGAFFRKGNTDPRRGSSLDREFVAAAPMNSTSTTREDTGDAAAAAVQPRIHNEHLAKAIACMNAGKYAEAAALTADLLEFAEATIVHVRALANHDVYQAEKACAAAAEGQPLSKELHYLHAVLLMDLHQHAAAADALRRVLYLDRSLALAHLSLGIVLRALGDLEGARRAFHDAHDISSAAPPDECVPLGDDEKAGDLAEFAKLQLDAVEKMTGDT